MFGASWRSSDMRTWIDFESIYGNGEDDFGDVVIRNGRALPRGGGSQYLAISSTDEYLDRFAGYLTATHRFSDRLGVVFESVYGFQEGGDVAAQPFAIVRDSSWYGANIGVRYRLTPNLHIGTRIEWFADENAANVLWGATGAGGGDVTALTLSLGWKVLPHLTVRPEIKLDTYHGSGHLFAPGRDGLAQHDTQLLGVANFEFRF